MSSMSKFRNVVGVLAAMILLVAAFFTPIFGNKPVLIVSGSMEPTIMTNALTVVHRCGISDIKVGDIVTYYHMGLKELVTHRVVKMFDGYALTRGDANTASDDIFVNSSNIYGKNIMILNWTAPIFERYMESGEFNRMELLTVLMMFLFFGGLAVIVVSLAISYSLALYHALVRTPYNRDDLDELWHTAEWLSATCLDANSLSWWKRLKLYMTYKACKRQLNDIKDELTKL